MVSPDSPTLGGRLFRAANRLYRGPIRTAIRLAGLNERLRRVRDALAVRFTDTVAVSVGGTTIRFGVSSMDEFERFSIRDLGDERKIITQLLGELGPEDIFYDIGANVGTYTCYAAAELGAGQTVAFEPETRNAQRLRENLERNGLDAEVLEVALSDTDGTVSLALAGPDVGEGEHAIATDDTDGAIEVPSARGDSLVRARELPPPTVVKIDVEGAELAVLEGMEEILEGHCRIAYVELHDDRIGSFDAAPADVVALLESNGFTVTELGERKGERFLRASK
jgi:FkbM family methyltransferase